MGAGLNLAQLQAVHYVDGPSLVLAGAGSGKTRVITHKMAHLLHLGCHPERLAAITFTNKAAAEMRQRAGDLVGRAAQKVQICTFHALGVRLLREDGERLGLKPKFSILSTADVLGLLKDCGSPSDKTTLYHWLYCISRWKADDLTPEQALAQATHDPERVAAQVMAHYQERLTAYQCVDFEDLIRLPLRLLQQHDDVRQRWQQHWQHLLVDEYQDTSSAQYEFLKALLGDSGHFTTVGDDDQSIYGWRGATLDNLKRLPQDYPTLRVIKLEQNYRSCMSILRAANHLIAPNPKLFPKTLWSELGEGEPVRVEACRDEDHEAERIASRLLGIKATQAGVQWRDMAVLYRVNHQSRSLEKALKKANIPYKVSGGQSFFERAEIRDLCAWFRLLANSDDDPAFIRAITTPKRGVGHTTLAQLGQFAQAYKVSLFEALFIQALPQHLAENRVAQLHEFGRYVNDLQHTATHTVGGEAAKNWLTEWLQAIGYLDYLKASEDHEKAADSRWHHVLDFCDWVTKRCGGMDAMDQAKNWQSDEKPLLEVVQSIALLSTLSEKERNHDVVTLSTLHAAKGLEWSHVVLSGVNEGLLPFRRDQALTEAMNDNHDSDDNDVDIQDGWGDRLEEERRLMYVGITRAQKTLAVTWQQKRSQGRKSIQGEISRFVAEMQLNHSTQQEDPKAKLKALREEFAKRAAEREQSVF